MFFTNLFFFPYRYSYIDLQAAIVTGTDSDPAATKCETFYHGSGSAKKCTEVFANDRNALSGDKMNLGYEHQEL